MNCLLKEWFKRPDTPSEHSPVGEMMVRVLAKFPQMTFEEARESANRRINEAAKRKKFQLPRVYSTEEHDARMEGMKERLRNRQQSQLEVHGEGLSPEKEEL